jgi:MOSC domain-containing protein YiiM
MSATVTAVSRSPGHSFSKAAQLVIRLLAGHGVEGDAHAGARVKHRSRVAQDPTQPNLRQVHLIAEETHDDLRARGFDVGPGDMGENITTRGIDLFVLPRGARLRLGDAAVVEVTGLRNPCTQLNGFAPGLMEATLGRDEAGHVALRAGIMGIVVAGGDVRPGDAIAVTLPQGPHELLKRV